MKHPLISVLHRLFAKGPDFPLQTVGKWDSPSFLPDVTPLDGIEFHVWAHLPMYDKDSSPKRS